MWAALRSVAELVKISAMVPAHSIPIWTRAAQVGISMRIFPGRRTIIEKDNTTIMVTGLLIHCSDGMTYLLTSRILYGEKG